MRVKMILAAIGLAGGMIAVSTPVMAGGFLFGGGATDGKFTRHQKSEYYAGKPQVRGYRRRVGGYSYARKDKYFFDISPSIKFGVEPNYATLPSVD